MNDLAQSYEVTKASGSSFRYSFFFLPREKRDAVTAVYAFCRAVDDVVDEEGPTEAEKLAGLAAWERRIHACFSGETPDDPLARALVPAIGDFHLPRAPFDEIIAGCRMDVSKTRYEDFAELETYCYRVASAVGLLCIEIFGYEDPRIKDYAVAMGMALQLTNILRDVADDYARGRIYLPREDLARFEVGEEDIAAGNLNGNLSALLRFQAERARSYYEKAAALLPPSERRSMLAAEIMGAVYHALLDKIEAGGFDVFSRKVTVAKPRRAWIALRTFAGNLLG